MELGGKKLVVKVDAKTKTVLDEYKGTFISAVIEFHKQYMTFLQVWKMKLFGKKTHFQVIIVIQSLASNGYSNTKFTSFSVVNFAN
jgi:hypothetical protein